FGIAKPLFTAKSTCIFCSRRVGPAAAIGAQVPRVPVVLAVARATQRYPQLVGGTLTIGQPSQGALAGIAPKAPGIGVYGFPLEGGLCAPLDPEDELHAQLRQHLYQRDIGKAPVGRDEQASLPNGSLHSRDRAADDRRLIPTHAPLQDRGIVGAPIDWHGPATSDQRDGQQMLAPLHRPIQSHAHSAFRRQLPQRLDQHGGGQAMGGQPRVVQQAREAFERGLLIAQAAGQLGLVPGLFLNDRVHKGSNPFELVAMCPGEHVRDILSKASSPRVLGCHKPRLSRGRTRGYSPPNECVLTSGSTHFISGVETWVGVGLGSNRFWSGSTMVDPSVNQSSYCSSK